MREPIILHTTRVGGSNPSGDGDFFVLFSLASFIKKTFATLITTVKED